MINTDKLKQVLTQYKANFPSWWNKEKYKWVAVKWFKDHWNIEAEDFGAMFKEATKKTVNLLNSGHAYPGGMICNFAQANVEATREMFRALFDDTEDNLAERVKAFQEAAKDIWTAHNDGTWRNHYQDTSAISVYLWLHAPDMYFIYRYQLVKTVAAELGSQYTPKKGSVESMIGGYQLYNEIREAIKADASVCKMIRNAAAQNSACYPDPEFVTAAIDVAYYLAKDYSEMQTQADSDSATDSGWLYPDYSPNLSTRDWTELLKNSAVFNESSLQIMARMKDYGGEATCKQLSEKYGEDPYFYNSGSSSLAERIANKKGCPVWQDEDGNKKWWPILYLGKNADSNTAGSFVWKLRDELREALEQTDLSSVKLYADGVAAPGTPAEPDSGNGVPGYWWLTANPAIWSFSSIRNGEEESYSLQNDRGNKRRIYQNFLSVKAGDSVICYEARPVKQIVAIGEITRGSDGTTIRFKKTESVLSPVDYAALKECPELRDMEFFRNLNGSLFKLSKAEYECIMGMIHDTSPLEQAETVTPYSEGQFLNDVYMEKQDYEDLKRLLLKKKNLILQGAPGVGKTFAAKRLAYSILGGTDNSRIEFVQFHQNTSYEDFVQGYRPDGKEFVLKNGLFYRFCRKAANDPGNKYFFIIDEINRGNMSKIFGELLMLIESDKRMKFSTDRNDEDSEREEYSATLAYTGERFSVPENVYLIGMMNTADRSLAMIDYALRRRFSFFEMKPAFGSDGFRKKMAEINDPVFNQIIGRIQELNRAIANDDSLGTGFQIGHSYFCGKPVEGTVREWLNQIIKYEIVPLLQEYWFDEKTKWETWRDDLNRCLSTEVHPAQAQQAGTASASGGSTAVVAEQ